MSGSHPAHSGEPPVPKRLNVFGRYLSLWVALCMGVGIFAGKMFPDAVDALRKMEFGKESQINIPIAVPTLFQVYFNSSFAYGLVKWLKVPHIVAAPGALIGASNFFELAVATAISLYGPGSGAALATVVGVLVEVPVMLSVCSFCNRTRHWFPVEKRA